jgi:hypothetical protein
VPLWLLNYNFYVAHPGRIQRFRIEGWAGAEIWNPNEWEVRGHIRIRFFGGAEWEKGPAEARTTRRWAQLAASGMSICWTRGEVGTEHAEEAQGDEALAKRVSRQNSQTMSRTQ